MTAPDTFKGLNAAFDFAKDHGKLIVICDMLDKHIAEMKISLKEDYLNILGTEIEHITAHSIAIRESTDLSECFDLTEKIFKIYDFISQFNQSWHFGHYHKNIINNLETILYKMYYVVEVYEINRKK